MANKDIALTTTYESAFGNVELNPDTVKQYLVKGNGEVTDQEVVLFIKMCQAQRLNPFVTGEVYLIKFGNTPAQMVVGYETYKRRADENPAHLFTESGIVVQRGDSIVQKVGACLYPTENLVGGWCRVHKLKDGREVSTYKEVGFNEYNKNNAIWKEKPCTMIEKVAISQCLREAYPKDYEGLYTAEELGQDKIYVDTITDDTVVEDDSYEPVTQEERKALFSKAQTELGKEEGEIAIKALLADEGLESTKDMTKGVYRRVDTALDELIKNQKEYLASQGE